MSYCKILHSRHLINLYKENKLSKVLSEFGNIINQKNYLGAGAHACTFRYKGGKEVLKLCAKKASYFKYFPLEVGNPSASHAQQFKKHVNDLGPYLLPINRILYEDKNVLIYTQDFCNKFNISKINNERLITIFRMVEFLVGKNILLVDISSNNLGLITRGKRSKQITVFDYHDLQPISVNGKPPTALWWRTIIKNLTKYTSSIYPHLPQCYLKLLDYVNNTKHPVLESQFCQLLNDCIKFFVKNNKKK